jgi:lipopolysaccharide/colanic/teichoic acid biosynthesis glycosyltransferase
MESELLNDLGSKRMEMLDISHSGVTSEQTAGFLLWKRMLDLALIIVVSPGLLILGAIVALVVICGSPGPVLFRQRRVGHKGREFDCYKFRTMHVDAETDSHQEHLRQLITRGGAMTKLDAQKDPRLIPLGALLRATGLDELPQLINVVRGEMSLVSSTSRGSDGGLMLFQA